MLAQAESPMLRSLEVDVVNDGFQVCRTHASRGDDCDDYFGVELFLKFHFPKKG